MSKEAFTKAQTEHAIEQFLDFGEQTFGSSHKGYFSGDGWAARCLRSHLEELKAQPVPAEDRGSFAQLVLWFFIVLFGIGFLMSLIVMLLKSLPWADV